MYKRLHDKGSKVLGFPCNQLGKQESDGVGETGAFCEKNYGVSFPIFGKIDVNSSNAHPLYKWLISEEPGVLGIGVVKWNFTKFLLYCDGTVYRHYAPPTEPGRITDDIERLLAEPNPA